MEPGRATSVLTGVACRQRTGTIIAADPSTWKTALIEVVIQTASISPTTSAATTRYLPGGYSRGP